MEPIANTSDSIREGNTTSFVKTLFNTLIAVTGIGILSIPYALASGGWLSLLFFFLISIGACYGGLLTQRCMETNPNIKTFSDIGQHAYGKMGERILLGILYVDLYLVLTGFLILEGDNLYSLFPEMKIELFSLLISSGKSCFVIVVALVILPSVWVDDLRLLAYISSAGVMSSFVLIVSVLWVAVFDNVGFHHKGEVVRWKGFPTALSLYMFSFGANPVFPSLYTSMRTKYQFFKVLVISFVIATFGYATMGILGYMMYGSTLNSQITLNLPKEHLGSKIAIYIAWITPLTKYALLMKPVATTTEAWLPHRYQERRLVKIILTTLLVTSQVILGLSVPFFGDLMSLVGALCSATASITAPCVCYMRISRIERKSIEGVVIMVLIALSILLVVAGTYTALDNLVKNVCIRKHH
ncbi:hypothetical protein DM860_007097 [Cuscuta australis]|uniref:Amino acid transporter transmembrane domain-containing protein n=1 Tax=Cuscuta australis TaxID=267555 RepID=A0A328E5X7_9ASTE|nr:hypothetical protein DM860_007097 [Cuscuta australis]